MCIRVRIPELGVDELVCWHRDALDLAVRVALRNAAARAVAGKRLWWERSAAEQAAAVMVFHLYRLARNRAGLPISPFD